MEIIILVTLAVIISKYLKKRSETVYSIHAVFFLVYLVFALFTSDLDIVVFYMQKICGIERYEFMCSLFEMPLGWLYSANVLIAIIEIAMALIVAYMATRLVFSKINKKRKDLNGYPNDGSNEKYPERKFVVERKIFLRFCRLLN